MLNRSSSAPVLALLVVVLLGTSAYAGTVVQWKVADGGNGHFYEVVQPAKGIDWYSAKSSAESMTYAGLDGHLATITSAAENAFVAALPGTSVGYGTGLYLGGYQTPGSTEPGGGWVWITGESMQFTNWHPAEPNDAYGAENVIELRPHLGDDWNDLTGTWTRPAFVVEYEKLPVVPLPAAAWMGLGLLATLGAVRRMRRRRAA